MRRFFGKEEKAMLNLKAVKTCLFVTVVLGLGITLVGCATGIPAELTAADQALSAAQAAGKDKTCPNEYAAAAKLNKEAHDLCPCYWDQAVLKANQARDAANALCPVRAAAAPTVETRKTAPAPAPAPAPTVSISASPSSVAEGKCSMLSWAATNASSASIDQGIGRVDTSGSRQVCPARTTTYTMNASGDGGSRDGYATVTVVPRVVDKLALHINFDFNKSTIKTEEDADLQKAIDFCKKYPASRIALVGYTDSIGKPEYNQKLSERRAAAVKDYLVKHGIDAGRIETSGRGENDPVADNKTDKGRAENRRVEISALSE
jgi:outer membrane protein OmpA-like peptidoglycan-associated protein